MECHCRILLSDKELHARLRESKFNVIVVDVMVNKCAVALGKILGVPIVTFSVSIICL